MIRLSRQAWNNVLIVTMIVMIFLFNSTNNILTGGGDSPEQAVPILADNGLILTMEVGAQKIERIGRNWRTNPPSAVPEDSLAKVMLNWQTGMMLAEEGPLADDPLVIVIWLAGESKGRVFQVFVEQQDVIIYTDSQRYRVLDLSLSELVVSESKSA